MKNMTELQAQLVNEDKATKMKYKEPIPIMINVMTVIKIIKKIFGGKKK